MSALVLSPAAPDPIATVADPPETQVQSNARRNKTAVAVLVLLTLLIGFWPLFDQAALPMDEGTLLVYPELVSHGQLPYRDFETFYGPANLWVLSAAFSTFGTNIFVERGVGLLYRVIVLLAIFGIAQRWGTILAAGVMFIAGMLLLPLQLPAYAWMGALACCLTALLVLTFGESKLRCFIAGLLAGFALLFRPDVGPAMLLSLLPFLYTVSLKRRLSYFSGFAAGLLPLCVLTLLAGPVQVLNNLFLFPVIHCNPARRLPLFNAGGSLLGLLLLHVVACTANFAAGFVALRRDHSKANARLLLGATLFSAGLTSQATQRLDMLHFFLVGFLSISLLPISLALLASAGRAYQSSRAVSLLAIFSVIALVGPIEHEATSVMWDAFSTAFDTSRVRVEFVRQRDRSFPFQSLKTARAAGKMFENLEVLSKSGERLFVGPADLRRTNGCDTFIYHLFPKLRPATYFLEMNPFSANRPGSRLAADVRSADWLVLNREQDTRQEPNRSVEAGSDGPNTVVQTRFSLIGEYPPYLLFRRKPYRSSASVITCPFLGVGGR